MAFTKQKVITSAKLVFFQDGTQATEIIWAKQVLEDGVVISSEPHAGAYPVDPVTGNPDQSVQTIMGIKLSKLFTNAGDNAIAALVTANANITTLQVDKTTALANLDVIKTILRAAKTEKRALRQRLKDNAIDDTDIPEVSVDDEVINAAAKKLT